MEKFEEYKTFKISPEKTKTKKIFFSESKSGSASLSPLQSELESKSVKTPDVLIYFLTFFL